MHEDSSHFLRLAEDAAVSAGEVLLKYFGAAEVHEKQQSSQNLVTQADLEAEQLVGRMIHDRCPDHTLLGEETEFTGDMEADHLWVIDPLDGTNNFAHNIPHFCVSIAYAQRGVTQVGTVYDPIRKEMFRAVRGHGAELNGRSIRVSQPTGLNRSIIATGFYYDRGEIMKRTLGSIERLFLGNIRGLRRMGAAALDLSWVACGRFEGFFEYRLSPWDYAAGALLVEEAGGRCSDCHRQPLDLTSRNIIAACESVADDLAAIVALPDA